MLLSGSGLSLLLQVLLHGVCSDLPSVPSISPRSSLPPSGHVSETPLGWWPVRLLSAFLLRACHCRCSSVGLGRWEVSTGSGPPCGAGCLPGFDKHRREVTRLSFHRGAESLEGHSEIGLEKETAGGRRAGGATQVSRGMRVRLTADTQLVRDQGWIEAGQGQAERSDGRRRGGGGPRPRLHVGPQQREQWDPGSGLGGPTSRQWGGWCPRELAVDRAGRRGARTSRAPRVQEGVWPGPRGRVAPDTLWPRFPGLASSEPGNQPVSLNPPCSLQRLPIGQTRKEARGLRGPLKWPHGSEGRGQRGMGGPGGGGGCQLASSPGPAPQPPGRQPDKTCAESM